MNGAFPRHSVVHRIGQQKFNWGAVTAKSWATTATLRANERNRVNEPPRRSARTDSFNVAEMVDPEAWLIQVIKTEPTRVIRIDLNTQSRAIE